MKNTRLTTDEINAIDECDAAIIASKKARCLLKALSEVISNNSDPEGYLTEALLDGVKLLVDVAYVRSSAARSSLEWPHEKQGNFDQKSKEE